VGQKSQFCGKMGFRFRLLSTYCNSLSDKIAVPIHTHMLSPSPFASNRCLFPPPKIKPHSIPSFNLECHQLFPSQTVVIEVQGVAVTAAMEQERQSLRAKSHQYTKSGRVGPCWDSGARAWAHHRKSVAGQGRTSRKGRVA
jgi:hypothetical protein